jgi:hypothetical protein
MQSRSHYSQPANRPLRLLFMATSPEDVRPVLDYEQVRTAASWVPTRAQSPLPSALHRFSFSVTSRRLEKHAALEE